MPLVSSSAPTEALGLVGRAVEDLMPPSGLRRTALALEGRSAAEASAPLPIYTLQAAALESADALAQAKPAGWRYLANSGSETSVVDLAGVGPEELRFNRMVRGQAPARLLEASAWAERESSGETDYEARILALPELHLEALWLAAPDADRFLLLRLPGAEPLREIDLVAEARRLAAERGAGAVDSGMRRAGVPERGG